MGKNVVFHQPLLSAQIRGRASHAQIHTDNAGRFYTCASASLEFGAVYRRWCEPFEHFVLFL